MSATRDETKTPRSSGAILRARKHRAKIVVGAIVATLVAVYLITVLEIGTSVEKRRELPEPPPGGISVSIVQVKVSAADPLTEALVVVQPDDSLVDSSGALVAPVTLSIYPSLGGDLFYRANVRPSAQTIKIPLEGDVEFYPFDSYISGLNLEARIGDDARTIPLAVTTAMRDPGWQQQTTVTHQKSEVTVAEMLTRARSTKAISILLLGFMVALAIVAGLVAAWVVAGMIEAGVGTASWLAALLFALLPLRNFLPGSPPVGSWIDVAVFFWVEIIIMISMLTVLVTTLARAKRDADEQMHEGE